MKRFLNRLRFAAAGNTRDLPGGILVGLGVIAHADLSLVQAFAESDTDLLTAVKSDTSPAMTGIAAAADPEKLQASDLPPFTPTRDQARRFLELWEGVTIRA